MKRLVGLGVSARVPLAALAALVSLVALVGCGADYDHTDISVVKSSVTGDKASISGFSIQYGSIMSTQIVVWNDDQEKMPVTFELADHDIVDLVGTAAHPDTYSFVAKAVGQTTLQIIGDGERIVTIPVTVVSPPTVP